MAIFRMFYINFWRDAFVVELTPEEKYFYIYIMTSPNTNHCGIYQISKKTMSFETGFNAEEVDNLLDKLTQCGYIEYCESSKEIMITNWIRENFINSPNNIKNLNGELKKVVNKDFIQKFYGICVDEEYPLDKLFQGIKLNFSSNTSNNATVTNATLKTINNSINTETPTNTTLNAINNSSTENALNTTLNTINGSHTLNDSNTENSSSGTKLNSFNSDEHKLHKYSQENLRHATPITQEPTNALRESDYEIQKPVSDLKQATTETEDPLIPLESSSAFEELDPEFKHLIKLFSSNIHPITPLEYVKLYNWTTDIEPEAIEIAILEAVNHNARSMSYINCILNNWISLGIKSKSQVENYQRKWNEKQNKNKGFQDYNSGNYKNYNTGNSNDYDGNYQNSNAANSNDCTAGNYKDCNGKYYCIPNVSAYDYVEFPEFENHEQ